MEEVLKKLPSDVIENDDGDNAKVVLSEACLEHIKVIYPPKINQSKHFYLLHNIFRAKRYKQKIN